jgi:hypothetical protein
MHVGCKKIIEFNEGVFFFKSEIRLESSIANLAVRQSNR